MVVSLVVLKLLSSNKIVDATHRMQMCMYVVLQ
jgi:hypothetical protein